MKLKTLVSSMALLSLVSTGAIAATHASHVPGNAVANSGSDFWQGIVYRNQDNNGTISSLATGQNKLTGLLEVDAFHSDKRGGFTNTTANNKAKYALSLHTAEMYFDWRANNVTSTHFAVDYDNQQVSRNTNSIQYIQDLSLSEAYATLQKGNLFLNAGLQYLRFGSASHDSIMAPMTEDFSLTSTTALSGGIFGLNGFYADASVFNGVPYGTGTALTDHQNSINGFAAEVGYAQNQGVNPFYGFNGLNTYFDYINDVADTNLVKTMSTSAGATALAEQHPAMAFHVGYVSGPFQLYANYVALTKKFETTEYTINGTAAKPSAYALEADYSWNPMHIQTIALGFEGSNDAAGITSNVAYGPTSTPKTRISLTYGYHLNKNVSLQGEYANEKDYATSDVADFGNGTSGYTGTGESANVFVGRLKVAF